VPYFVRVLGRPQLRFATAVIAALIIPIRRMMKGAEA
jgi:hypothetical protein